MGYLESTLSDGEEIIHKTTFHWFYTLGAWLILLFGALFSALVWFFLKSKYPDYTWYAFVIFGLFLLIFLRLMIIKWTTEIAVTNKRFLIKQGWIMRHTSELPMHRVEEVGFRQSVFGRIFGYGKLQVSGTGGDKAIVTPNIDDPLALRKAIGSWKQQ